MIYICYIIYRDYLVTCVLAVEDGKLTVGDDDDTSLGVAEVRHVQEARELTWTGQWHDLASRFRASGEAGAFCGPRISINFVISILIGIFVFYSLLQIQ